MKLSLMGCLLIPSLPQGFKTSSTEVNFALAKLKIQLKNAEQEIQESVTKLKKEVFELNNTTEEKFNSLPKEEVDKINKNFEELCFETKTSLSFDQSMVDLFTTLSISTAKGEATIDELVLLIKIFS